MHVTSFLALCMAAVASTASADMPVQEVYFDPVPSNTLCSQAGYPCKETDIYASAICAQLNNDMLSFKGCCFGLCENDARVFRCRNTAYPCARGDDGATGVCRSYNNTSQFEQCCYRRCPPNQNQ
ncbi:unnamed protein product [Hyaloperonospora brassicae]|uniref:Cysteine-rich protein n=1 Tax=Hyaloperonospora brassicae TaxID=162125 RepID=A0AAV0TZ68_HYABA|nr:unnamed protein product [Hyaloperonospora brassicae]